MSEALTAPDFTTIPVGPLALIALPGCEELAAKIDAYLKTWREIRESEHKTTIAFSGYQRDSYLVKAAFPRFGSGEAKCHIQQSVRGYDIFIVCDMFNYGVKKLIGAYAAAMGGVDAIVFTGGIGENGHWLRSRICSYLGYMGVQIDEELNQATVKGAEAELTDPSAKVRVFILATDEELVIAQETQKVVESLQK